MVLQFVEEGNDSSEILHYRSVRTLLIITRAKSQVPYFSYIAFIDLWAKGAWHPKFEITWSGCS